MRNSIHQPNRREFIRRSAAGLTSATMIPYLFTSPQSHAQESKNDRPRIGVIGLGGQGQFDAGHAVEYGDIVAICDVNTLKFGDVKQRLGDKLRDDVATYQDYRRLLDRNDIDVVIQATTDHWHTKINIDALRSGRDVYGEKPFALTIEEGKLLRKVVKETGRVFQLGTQQRSAKQVMDGGIHPRPFQEAVELVRNGRIGKLKQVWVAIPFLSMKGGPFEPQACPDCLDWEMYQGQSPMQPYTARRYHPFRGWFDYCGSMAADWGNHHYDIAHWGMDVENTGPVSIECRGIFPNEGKPDCFDVPDQFFARLNYANGMEVLFFTSLNARYNYGWPTEPHIQLSQEKLDWMFGKDVSDEVKTCDRNGVMFIGDRGRIFVNRANVYGRAEEELADNPLPDNAWRVRPSEIHMKNFFDCVKSRDVPVAHAEVGHRSLTPCQLAVISMRLGGRKLQWDPEKEQIVGDGEARAMQAREQREPYTIL
ncbi:MAG: Gfo/Idh/MocA family oxidoreductase [Planctomycetaceae bacterium]|nr:Gfo/Idh/MocA family oxidoreductase [Planctomycetaceae bacterium]